MDNSGVRKRREVTKESVDTNIKEDPFRTTTSTNINTRWNENYRKSGDYVKNKNSGININENFNKYVNSIATSFSSSYKNKTNNGIDTWRKDDKKKGVNIFNSSNISTISSTCKKSFNDMINNFSNIRNFNENMPGSGINTAKFAEASNKMKNVDTMKFTDGKPNNINTIRQTDADVGIYSDFLYNGGNDKGNEKIDWERNNNSYKDFTFNTSMKKQDEETSYNLRGAEKNIDVTNKVKSPSGEFHLNSSNLENFLNRNVHNNTGDNSSNYDRYNQSYKLSVELNSMKLISNDETYFVCLDNLLRNHGNIDSEEMLKYNEKNINFLNDIIFLDVYRAYNVMTYMQNKINLIILTIKFLGKKLKRKHVPEEIVISLEFLSFCVKNIGLFFVRHIDESFMKKLSKLLRTTTLKKSITKNVKSKLSKFLIVPVIHPGVATDPRLHFIKRKILFLMQLWHDAFIMHKHLVSPIYEEYRYLREKGICFPVIDKSEKFFVKDSESSLRNKNVFTDLPLSSSQIENILSSVKQVTQMKPGEEKQKCIFIISKYKNQVIECIKKLSEYKGNLIVEPTLNSLLCINDEIDNWNKVDNDLQNVSQEKEGGDKENDDDLVNVNKTEGKKSPQKKKKKKGKEQGKNLNELIFTNFDPWDTSQIAEKNKTEPVDDFFGNKSPDDLFNNNTNFSFSSTDLAAEKKESIYATPQSDVDKYNVFNEIQMDETLNKNTEQTFSSVVKADEHVSNENNDFNMDAFEDIYTNNEPTGQLKFPKKDEPNVYNENEVSLNPDITVTSQKSNTNINWTTQKQKEEMHFDSFTNVDVSIEEMLLESKNGKVPIEETNDSNLFDNLNFNRVVKTYENYPVSNKIKSDTEDQISKKKSFNSFIIDDQVNKGIKVDVDSKKEKREDNVEEILSKTVINDTLKHCSTSKSNKGSEVFVNSQYGNAEFSDMEIEYSVYKSENIQRDNSFAEYISNKVDNLKENEEKITKTFSLACGANTSVDEISTYTEKTTNDQNISAAAFMSVHKENNTVQKTTNESNEALGEKKNDEVNNFSISEIEQVETEKTEGDRNAQVTDEKHVNEKDSTQYFANQEQEKKQLVDSSQTKEYQEMKHEDVIKSEEETDNILNQMESDNFNDNVTEKKKSNTSDISNINEKKKALEKKSDVTNSSDMNDLNIEELDEISRVLDDLSSNLEGFGDYKYD